MTLLELVALAVALAMDAFAVAVSSGCMLRRLTWGHYGRLAGAFGFFQFFMPVVGWYLGVTVRPLIEHWDHWIAFALLVWIGGNMVRESFRPHEDDVCPVKDPTRGRSLVMLAVATSIDALAVGLSLAVLKMSVWGPAALIGVVCGLITVLGLFLGGSLARAARLGRWAELGGGLVLVLIGLKILYEHNALADLALFALGR